LQEFDAIVRVAEANVRIAQKEDAFFQVERLALRRGGQCIAE
jgi:hypothetical protein